jgi:hypothetical protein
VPSLAEQVGAAFRDSDKLIQKTARHLLTSPPSDRRADCIHPSEAASDHWCQRAVFYRLADYTPEPVPGNLMFETVYETGHDAHHKWQRWWWEMGILAGVFHCMHCDVYWNGLSPQRCPYCEVGRELLEYKEVPLENEEYGIAGFADGDVVGHGLVEVKTIGEGTVRIEAPNLLARHTSGNAVDWHGLWRDIKIPFASHRRQGMIYDFCAGRDQMTFIYEPKFITGYPKEFVVKFKKEYIEDILDDCLRVRTALEHGRPPKRPMWAERSHRSCQKCPYRKHCYDNRPHREAQQGTDRNTGRAGEATAGVAPPSRVRYAKVADESYGAR